ncbi:MAG: hypothetical protein Q8M92_06280 [Candidatus Subteraquimicrobiales bacterium]|nr:hypothetical protein [Candidatus Subteraquimicrobiales bacterium]
MAEFGDFLSEDLRKFVDEYLTTFVIWDLLIIFAENPGLVDSAENIAVRLGRKEKDTEAGLKELTKKNLLKETKREDMFIYELTDDLKTRKALENFVLALNSREKRLIILTRMFQERNL